jgi:hypothetical protein
MGLPLITRAEYKAFAGIASTNSDAIIDSLIPKISELVKTYCRRSFIDYADDPKLEYAEGGLPIIVLDETPVINVSSIEVSTDYGNTYTTLEEFKHYVVSKVTGNIKAINIIAANEDNTPRKLASFPLLTNGYKITYTGGYEKVPEDLKLALYDLVTYYIKNDSAIHSTKAPGSNTVQIEYITTTSLPAHIRRVLDLYKSYYS